MDRTDVERTDFHPVAFLRGWAEAFPDSIWIAGIDLRNSPRRGEFRLKAARPSWSGPVATKGISVVESYDFHLECTVGETGKIKGTLKVHLETNPYPLEKRLGCTSGKPSAAYEVCQRRSAAKRRLVETYGQRLGIWQISSESDKLTLLKLPLKHLAKDADVEVIATFLRSHAVALDEWITEALHGWTSWSI